MEYLYQHLAHFYGPQVGKYTMEHMGYPLVNVYKKPWKDPQFYSWEAIHYFDWA
jgi:hypothetical protein